MNTILTREARELRELATSLGRGKVSEAKARQILIAEVRNVLERFGLSMLGGIAASVDALTDALPSRYGIDVLQLATEAAAREDEPDDHGAAAYRAAIERSKQGYDPHRAAAHRDRRDRSRGWTD